MMAELQLPHPRLIPTLDFAFSFDDVDEASPTDYATQMSGTATFWNRCGEATTADG
jgi:hypothetical protein